MHKKLIIAIGGSLIFIITNLALYFFFTGELKNTHQAIEALANDIAALKTEYTNQIHYTDDKLAKLIENINLIQTDSQKKINALKNNLTSLNADIRQKYNSLSMKWLAENNTPQLPAASDIDVKETGSTNNHTLPQPLEKALPDLEDIKMSTYFTAGKHAFAKCEYAKAKQAFGNLLNLNPPLWEAHLFYIQAVYYENPGKAATDKTVKELLASLPPEYDDNGMVTKYKGLISLERGDYNGAVDALVNYHTLRKEAESLLALGESYLALKKQDDAYSVFTEILTSFPGSTQAKTANTYITKIRENS